MKAGIPPVARAVSDVAAARLANLVKISPFASRWALGDFSLPSDGARAWVLTETENASRGLGDRSYEECVGALLVRSAMREAAMTSEPHEVVHLRLEATWARYRARRS